MPEDLTHYVVPDVGVVVDYLEILEFRELQGIVFTQTACQAVQHSKGRRYARTGRLNVHTIYCLISGWCKCGRCSGRPFFCVALSCKPSCFEMNVLVVGHAGFVFSSGHTEGNRTAPVVKTL